MVTSALVSVSRCCTCRRSLLKSLIAISGISLTPCAALSSRQSSHRPHQWTRSFSRTNIHRSSIPSFPRDTVDFERGGDDVRIPRDEVAALETSDADTAATDDSIPWYLQVDPPKRESRSLLDRQKLPELPENPPPLLQPILEHIFTDLGLDDLLLLDLRKMDPPPALGANLLMIIGTARSEKHLHVSADRFCIWMKNTHKIAPFADGLLGRGELKLRLKRKARRARILSRVGSTEVNSTDDGIRTGWICVTLENIEDGRAKEEIIVPIDDYIGFGAEGSGAKVVIQMLTQEKREELDLETLWGQAMRRYLRKEDRISKEPSLDVSEHEVGQLPTHEDATRSDMPLNDSSSRPRPKSLTQQTRSIHSHANAQHRLRNTPRHHTPAVSTSATFDSARSSSTHYQASISTDTFLANLAFENRDHDQDALGSDSGTIRLQAHLDHLSALSPQEARLILYQDPNEITTHPFMISFRDSLPLFPATEHWACQLELYCYGLSCKAPGYNKAGLHALFSEMQSAVVEIPPKLYIMVLQVMLDPIDSETSPEQPSLSPSSLHSAVTILEDMSFRGHYIATDEIRSMLEPALALTTPVTGVYALHTNAPQRLRRLMHLVCGKLPSSMLELQKLHAFADVSNWEGVWEVWHGFARDMRPRPYELYYAMFERLAGAGHRAHIMRGLPTLMAEMKREEPSVMMDRDLAEAVMACLRVLEPKIETEAADAPDSVDENQRLWRQCDVIIQEGNRFLREYDDD